MIRRDIVSRLAPRLSPDGFKILIDVLLSAGGDLNIVEIPYSFRKRNTGESKLTLLVGIDFLGLVVHHATAGLLPIRFVLFAIVGASGLVVHFVALSAALHWFKTLSFDSGQLIATTLAMASNFVLNNQITYRCVSVPWAWSDTRFRGFCAGMQCRSLSQYRRCFLALRGQSDLVGCWTGRRALSVVWNYAVSTNLIWRPGRRR